MSLSEFLKAAESISNIKKQEVPLPIAKKYAVISPLKVGDDLALRTSLTSPVNYDREMIRLIHRHTEIQGPDGELIRENYEHFCATTSNIDKLCLIWGLYKTTYETLGKRTIRCDKESCKTEFKQEIFLDDLVKEDTFVVWEEELPFHEYIYVIEVPYDKFIYIFESKIPTIRDNNRLLSNLSVDTLQNNLQSTGMVFSRAEQMALLTKSVIIQNENKSIPNPPRTDNLQEMLIAFKQYIPHVVSEDFFKAYRDKFDKYYPQFYTIVRCPACSNEIRYQVDLEVEFFRRSIYGRGESSEEL